MLPACNSGAGMNVGFPDVCVTPVGPVPTPIPYPNMALNATAVPFAPNVLVSFVPALNMGATMPITLGDQAGTLSPFMGPGRYTMGNPTVMVNALPAVSLLCPTTGNNMVNALGAAVVPSVTNVFYSRAGGPCLGAIDADGIDAIDRALAEPLRVERAAAGVLALTVRAFSRDLPARVHDALRRAGELAALVLDLRACPGGELAAAVALASSFLDDGAAIVTATDQDGDAITYRARGVPHRVRLVVLVDRFTASAAEVFAGALRAHGRAVVIGERTYGKGTAQTLLPGFTEPGASYATIAALTLPNGEPLHGHGVAPDVACAPEAALAEALEGIHDQEVR